MNYPITTTDTVNGKNNVTNDPNTDKTTGNGKKLESYIFYDPWVNRDHDVNGNHTGYNASDLNEAIILQSSIAIFMEIYSGKSKITPEIQKEMGEKIHLVPLSDLNIGDFPTVAGNDKIEPENYDPLKVIASPGINATKSGFSTYWNKNLSGKNIQVLYIVNALSMVGGFFSFFNSLPSISGGLMVTNTGQLFGSIVVSGGSMAGAIDGVIDVAGALGLFMFANSFNGKTNHGNYRSGERGFSDEEINNIIDNYSKKGYQPGGKTVYAKKVGN